MNEDGYAVAVVGALVVAVVVIEMVRRRHLRGRFALVWIGVAAVMVLLTAFPDVLGWAATVTRVKVPLNLLFFVGFLGLLIAVIHLSAESGRLEERTRILAEEVAVLRSMDPGGSGEGDSSKDVTERLP